MKVFYCNLVVENNTITSFVKGVHISLAVQQLGKLLKVPYEGVKIKALQKANFPCYNKKAFYYSLSRLIEEELIKERKLVSIENVKHYWVVGNLFIYETMLHYFHTYVLVPKNGNYVQINDVEIHLLYDTLNEIQVNWAYVIMHHMALHDEDNASLLYNVVLTKKIGSATLNFQTRCIWMFLLMIVR